MKIEKLIHGGHGMGRDGAGIVFIPGTAVGEVVEWEEDGSHGGIRVGKVTKIIERSPSRRDPPCAHAGVCGGCDWLHLTYDEQVRCKKEIFLDCVNRIGKFSDHPEDIEVLTADEFGYRSRAQIKVDHDNRCVGFFKRKTNDVVRIDRCPLLTEEINDVLIKLNYGDGGYPRNAPPQTDNAKTRMLKPLRGQKSPFGDFLMLKDVNVIKVLAGKSVASDPVICGLTEGNTEIEVAGVKFLADGGSFFQSNKFLLETMGRWFVNNNNDKYRYGLDLYGGIGFFSLMLSDVFENITLVENVPAQVRAAERNFYHNGRNNLKAVLADVERSDSLDNLTTTQKPDCVIIDPPRPGLVKKMRKWLIDAAPPTILYISCNPSTFARDAGALVKDGGYKLSRWALFDLYPNTHHIESAAVFTRPY